MHANAIAKIGSIDWKNMLDVMREIAEKFGVTDRYTTLADRSIEPRLSQVFVPLLSVIEDPDARNALRQVARDYHRDMVADRGMDVEAQMLETIQELQQEPFSSGLAVKEITERFIARHSEDFDWKVTPHWAGKVIRKKLGLKTEKHHGNYFIAASEGAKLARLFEKYGVDADSGDLGDSAGGDSSEEGPQDLPLL